MKVKDIIELLNAEILVEGNFLGMEVTAACGADLMSDVMAYVKDNVILLTGLANPQVIRTAEMMDINAVVLVRGKKPDECFIRLAHEKGVTVLGTKYPMFISCGKLYSVGVAGGERY